MIRKQRNLPQQRLQVGAASEIHFTIVFWWFPSLYPIPSMYVYIYLQLVDLYTIHGWKYSGWIQRNNGGKFSAGSLLI